MIHGCHVVGVLVVVVVTKVTTLQLVIHRCHVIGVLVGIVVTKVTTLHVTTTDDDARV